MGRQSPALFEAAATGRELGNADLTITEQGRRINVLFSRVFISNYKEDLSFQSTVQGDATPLESVSLNFESVQIQVGSAKF